MLSKVCPLKSHRIRTEILSAHKTTNIYTAVGQIFEIWIFSKNIQFQKKKKKSEKFKFFVNFQNLKNLPHSSIDRALLVLL